VTAATTSDDQHVAARVGRAPDPDPVVVELGQGSGVGDGVALVAHLRLRVDLLARLTSLVPKLRLSNTNAFHPAAAKISA
jgi:hypothetical protein